jgi:hypothetical protein
MIFQTTETNLSRPASWAIFCTGKRRQSRTLREPRWISALTSVPGAERNCLP